MTNMESRAVSPEPSRTLEYGRWAEKEIESGGRIVSIRPDGKMANLGEEPGTSINVLGLTNYVKSRLTKKGITTVEQLEILDERTLRFGFANPARGFGNKSINHIGEALDQYHNSLLKPKRRVPKITRL
jgi:hypothetical protein